MAATGYTPIYLYYSSTTTNQPSAGNLGYGELAINITDKNLFFKDNTNTVNTVPIRQSSGSSNGWLSSTDWTTFNSKQPAGTYVTSVSGTSPIASSGGTTPTISLGTVPIANGGTNATSFNAAVSSVNGLVWFDGTRLVNDATPSDIGYNASTNTFYAKNSILGSANTDTTTVSGQFYGRYSTAYPGLGGLGMYALVPTLENANVGGLTIQVQTGGPTGLTDAIAINSKGNVAISGSLSPWSTTYTPITQIGSYGVLANLTNGFTFASNWYYNAGDKYINANPATLYQQYNGTHSWYGAASGSAGAAITFTQSMGIDASNNVTVNAGNLVIGTSGKGIDFSATPGTGTSELFADYEEGTWTPTVATGINSPTYATQTGRYTKIGNTVVIHCYLSVNGGTRNGGGLTIGGLPYANVTFDGSGGAFSYVSGGMAQSVSTSALPTVQVSTTAVYFYKTTGADFVGTDLSSSTFRVDFTCTYSV